MDRCGTPIGPIGPYRSLIGPYRSLSVPHRSLPDRSLSVPPGPVPRTSREVPPLAYLRLRRARIGLSGPLAYLHPLGF